ncbi:MAG: hypothetical protein M0R80_27165 [Proteobacteria bacterium]|jgi:hypothetical protein|nr:hypothetical protein [Pseudomonadota bacterium]
MERRLRIAAAAFVLLSIAPRVVLAQDGGSESLLEPPKPRQGYYFSLGAVGSIAGHDVVDRGWMGPWPGVGGELRVGQAILPWLDLGISAAVVGTFEERWTAVHGRLSIEAQIRPVAPLAIRLYGGFGVTDPYRRAHGAEKLIGRVGGTYGVAVGWDFFPAHDPRRSGGFAVTPFVWFEGSPDPNFATVTGGIGIEITFWTGLAKNELVLPDDEAFSP